MTDGFPLAVPLEFSLAWDGHEPVDGSDATPTPWEAARAGLAQVSTYWLATVTNGGHPHLVPLLAVMVDDALHFCASDRSRKARNLAAHPQCVLGGSSAALDFVVEGEALRVDDEAFLARVADAYDAKYAWKPRVQDRGLWADGAPTAGPPPYRVYRLAPARVFGFPTDDEVVPTRWEFTKRP